MERHPSVNELMKFFAFSHLPETLQTISKPFGELAERIADVYLHTKHLRATP